MNSVAMEEFIGTPSGIEYLDLQPSQRITLQNITLINAGTRGGVGIHINNIRSMSWWDLEVNAAKRLVSLETMCGGPTSLVLQEGQPQWIVNGIRKRVRLRCHRTVKAPDGFYIRVTVMKTAFSYPSSRNSLTIRQSLASNETNEIASLHYYNQVSQSGNPRVFTSDGSTITLLLQASNWQDAFFLAKFDAMRNGESGSELENPVSLDIIDITARNFVYGLQVSSEVTNVHIDRSTLSSCAKGLYVQGVAEGNISVESTVAIQNSDQGIYISSLLGSVTLSNVSVVNNNDHGIYINDITGNVNMNDILSRSNSDHGIYISDITGTVNMRDILSHSNNDNGIYTNSITGTVNMSDVLSYSNSDHGIHLQNIRGSALLTDVVASDNGVNDAGINIYHSSGQQGQYNIVNVTCLDNRGKGMSIDVPSEAKVDIRTSLVQGNEQGGIFANFRNAQTSQYSAVILHNSEILNNKRFALHVTGKHTSLDIANSTISYNSCPYQPAVGLEGEPKDVNVTNNLLASNNARETLSILFGDNSRGLSSKINVVGNVFRGNIYDPSQTDGNFQYSQHPDHTSCTIEIGGCIKSSYHLSQNMLDNPDMNYTMYSRVYTTSPDETIDARYNWWGTAVETEIQDRISDFDDWNDRAPVDYFPYLTGPDLSSSPADPSGRDVTMATDNIGGRLYHPLHLHKDGGPYTIKADLTVMKNASLTIDPGSTIKVHPCVGLLNLGSLVTHGTSTEPINYDIADVPVHQPQVRLVGGRFPWEGRVEVFYNGEWGTVCGRNYWGSQDANVICRELGYESCSDCNTNSFGPGTGRIWIGRYTSRPDCDGHEMSIFNCLQGEPGNTDSSCTHAHDVGVRCIPKSVISPRPICTTTKWGGIKANSNDSYSETMKHIVIKNTGSLHGSASSGLSIGAVEEVANVSSIHISECEGIGLEVLGGNRSTAITDVTIHRCFGDTGISIVGRKSHMVASRNNFVENSFLVGSINLNVPRPFVASDGCDGPVTIAADKGTITSLNYGQSNYPNNLRCEWLIVVSRGSVILQFVHLNTESGYDYITIYDGPTTSSASLGLFQGTTIPPPVVSSGREVLVTFRTDGSVTREGFELEFSSTESEDVDVDDEVVGPCTNIIQDSTFRNNTGSSINITAIGDATLDIQRNIFSQIHPRGENYEDAVIYSSGNIAHATFSIRSNNLVDNAIKGLYLNTLRYRVGTITVLENQFFRNKAGSLMMTGGDSQIRTLRTLSIKNNVFSSNEASDSENIVSIENLNGHVENNTVFNNSGHYMVNWQGVDTPDNHSQVCENNLFYDNIGMMPGEKYTIVVSGKDVELHGNVLTNPANDAELATSHRTPLHPVNATYNWWGSTSRSVIESRIRDKNDQDQWAEVFFDPWAHDPPHDGPCDLGWTYSKVLSACYRYMGGSQTWDNAVKSCQGQFSILARSFSGLERTTLDNLLSSREEDFLPGIPVWMEKGVARDNSNASCKTYHPTYNGVLQTVACTSYYPFFCKRPVVDDCPNSCSHHGSCERQTCICQRGWEEEDCSQFNCGDRNNCGEFGTCVGPNICRCRNGWQGRACTVSYCNRFTSCKSCTREVGCGWCEERQSCEPGLYKGPDVTPCNAWFYHGCFTVGQRHRCSEQIETIDCDRKQCNTALSTTTVESCLRCQDIEGCFKESNENYCHVWNEDQCPKGFIHPLYNDTTRIEKILIGHNVEYVPLEGNILYRCPVRFSSWGATMFVNEGDLDIRIGQVLSSPQANGVLHKVEQVIKSDSYTVIVAHPATLEDMLDYSDFSQEVELEMAVDMKRNEGAPELSVVERVLSGNGTLNGSTVHIITEDAPVYKCIGARAMNEGEGSYHLLMRDIPVHLSVGDVIVSNHSNGILERVIQQTATPHGVFIQTQLQDCFTTFNFREELTTTDGVSLPASLPCSGGPDGAHGLLIVDSAGREVDLETGDVVVGRRSGRLLAKVLNITTAAGYTLVEVEPILSRSTMTMPSRRRRRREDVTTSPPRLPLDIIIEDEFSDLTDSYNIKLSTSGRLSAGIKLSLAVSTSDFGTPTLKKAEAFFVGGRLDVGLGGSLIVSERTRTRGGFRTSMDAIYGSLCVSGQLCIPAKIWADLETSYEIYAEGPGSIQMSSTVVKPDIDGGGSWQPQEGSQWFSFVQNNESGSANIVISSYSGTATESDHLIILELKVKPRFFIEFPTSGEIEVEELTIPLDVDDQGDAFGYSITTSIQSQALLRVSAQSCSTECPYSDRPQYVGVTSSLDHLTGTFNVIVGNNDYYEEQQWRREEWMDSDRNCKAQPSSIDTCANICSCPGGATGVPHPTSEGFCMCPCDCGSGNRSFTHPDISGDGCNCELCPDGDFKTVNSEGHLYCPCLCPDNSTSKLTSSGKCDCSCPCPDGSRDVLLSGGSCPCKCTCNNCHESVLGPEGCICSDSCPDCENDEEPEWQDCVCKCPQKTECGIPPTCVVGRMGPDCRQPDCRPCQGCSGNGRCTTSTDSCQSSCVCWPQWFGDCCELRRPRPIGGDPHLQTLDGTSYDYHGIGEFWDCKSVSNDFGVQTRMYAFERASLIGGVAVKAGHSVVTLMTLPSATAKDVPTLRIDGELCQLSVGEKYLLNNGTIHLLAQQPSTNATESGAVIIVSITFASGATVSFDVRYSPKMGRQFVNILFSPTATFKGNTEGLCGLMDDNNTNDFTGPDGSMHNDSSVFAETWRINKTHHGSGLMGSWSWNSSNFHPGDVMDHAYSDPNHRPSVGIDGLTQEEKEKAEEMCIALGLTGTLLNECIFDVSITNDTTFTEQEVFKGCPNQCSGRGRCVNGTCECITGWSGEDCNLGNCTDCSEAHGKCELGFCVCEPGWEGAACDQQATCYGVNNCTSEANGICITTDVCRCEPGYIGADCSKVPTCGNVANCTDHGVCVDYDTCLCDEQWTGDKCDQFSCAGLDYCSGHGRCVDIDVCYCERGWTGSSCVTPDCPAVNQCSRQGDCVGPNICQCYSGYQGLDCSEAQSCPDLQECSENGACVISSEGNEECRCFPGFSGANCSHPDCTEQNNCTDHGSCIEPNLCQCDSGYTGNDCANFSCEALQYCSGHGSCVRFDTCSCDPDWSGGSCNDANCSSKNGCSSQGTCVAPNTCECFPGFQGEDCSEENVPNENPPTFQKDKYDATIPENQPIGTAIVTVYANDTDLGRNGEVRYRLVQTGLDDENFAVHPTSGIVNSVVEFDFESLDHTSFTFMVEAFDQGVPTLTGTATITINITDQNDNKPVISIPPDTEYNLQATSPIGFHVTTIQASDADRSNDNSRISYGITSVSPFVSIDATNGSVTVSSALESGTYVVKVRASDHGSPPKTDERSLRMIVTNVSTNTAPQCPEDEWIEIASHNLTRGSTVATIEAEDPDNGPNGNVSYSFKSQTGELASLFGIDPSTGRIYVQTEVPQINDTFSAVSMTVEVRDNAVDSLSCETKVFVIITSPEFSGTVPDNVFPTTTTAAATTATTTAAATTAAATTAAATTATTTTAAATTATTTAAATTAAATTTATTAAATTATTTAAATATTTAAATTTTAAATTTTTAAAAATTTTSTPLATTSQPKTTPFHKSTTGSTTQPDITTDGYTTSTAPASTTEVPMAVEACSFRGVLKIMNRDWKDELGDKASDEFKTFAAEVQEELDGVFSNSSLGDTYDSVEVTSFSRGSVKVDFTVRFKSPTAIDTDDVQAVLSGKKNIGGLEIDDTVTSIIAIEVTGDDDSAAWYHDPIYISVICVGAAVVVTAIVVLVICCASKGRRKPAPRHNHAQRLLQQHMLIPRAKLSREPARQMYQNPVYSVNE